MATHHLLNMVPDIFRHLLHLTHRDMENILEANEALALEGYGMKLSLCRFAKVKSITGIAGKKNALPGVHFSKWIN